MPGLNLGTLIRRLALAALAGIAIAGCASAAAPDPTPAVAATPAAARTAPASPAPASAAPASPVPSPVASGSPVAEGTLSCLPLGASEPRYTVTVPDGWSGHEGECGFVLPDGEGFTAGLSAWIVGTVPTDPCRNLSTLVTPEDGVDGLVQAILAQEGRNATAPVDVSLAGFEGRYLEWTVPNDVEFTGGDEFYAVGCDGQNYLSWNGRSGGTRYQQVPGQVDQLWVLDLDGQPVVIDASYAPDAPAAIRAELAAVVDSLRFEVP